LHSADGEQEPGHLKGKRKTRIVEKYVEGFRQKSGGNSNSGSTYRVNTLGIDASSVQSTIAIGDTFWSAWDVRWRSKILTKTTTDCDVIPLLTSCMGSTSFNE